MRRFAPAFSLLVLSGGACGHTDGTGGGNGPGDVCGDGYNDQDCPCSAGQSQSCWSGDLANRGQGNCQDGIQRCQGADEFTTWGPCMGAVLPSDDVGVDGIDQDCDGDDGQYGSPIYPNNPDNPNGPDGSGNPVNPADGGPPPPPSCSDADEVCDDGVDNNCNQLVDCMDYACVLNPMCFGSCIPIPFIGEDCGGGYDEDCDGAIDCADSDCAGDYDCACRERCTPEHTRWCDTPSHCNWGTQRCNPDGTWGACIETYSRPPGCEGSAFAYDRSCCLASPNACCQDFPANYASVGECAGTAVCIGP